MLFELHTLLDRQCGDCTACCFTPEIRAINKKTQEWCPDCEIGIGCKRYDSRPHDCRRFCCLWLYGHGTEDDRPDKLGIVQYAEINSFGDRQVTVTEYTSGALRSTRVIEIIRELLEEGTFVGTIPLHKPWQLIVPTGKSADHFSQTFIKENNVEVVEASRFPT